jgi:hypothetical protein
MADMSRNWAWFIIKTSTLDAMQLNGNEEYVVCDLVYVVSVLRRVLSSVLGQIDPTLISVPRRNLYDAQSARPFDAC